VRLWVEAKVILDTVNILLNPTSFLLSLTTEVDVAAEEAAVTVITSVAVAVILTEKEYTVDSSVSSRQRKTVAAAVDFMR
jgi:hypothetical protein